MKTYVISLPDDVDRRRALRSRFKADYEGFEFITAVGVPDISQAISSLGVSSVCRWLTRPEVACSLSHLIAIEAFLRSREACCLILEDDVIGEPQDLRKLADVMDSLPSDAFLLCGGQQGLCGSRYAYGKPTSVAGVFAVPEIARRFFARTCCYCLTPAKAERILAAQREKLGPADDWHAHLRGVKNFFFIDQIRHPEDPVDSRIEAARISVASSRIQKLIRDGVVKTMARNVAKLLLFVFASRMALRRIL